MTEKHIEQLHNDAFGIAQKALEEDGAVIPHVFVVEITENGERGNAALIPVGPLQNSQRGKDVIAALVKKLSSDMKNAVVIYISEAWLVLADKDEAQSVLDHASRESLETHAKRAEAVVVTIQTSSQQWLAYHIIKRDTGAVSLEKGELHEAKSGDLSGRFARDEGRTLH